MTKEVKKELSEAKKLYQSKNYREALEIYEKSYAENSNEFNKWDKIFYSWALYQLYIKNFDDETELMEYTELITELIRQSDLNKSPTCAYTLSVFKVLDYLYRNEDYEYLLFWLEKIDPNLLDSEQSEFNGRIYPSRKEKYYNYASKAYFESRDYENCILISDKALRSFDKFTNDSDVWYNWRIAKSLKELGKSQEALKYLEEVSKAKNDWFIYKEIAENYFIMDESENALNYVVDAVLTKEPPKIKVNLFYLIYNLLKDDNPEIALKHAKLVKALKMESGAPVPNEIEELVSEDNLDIRDLEYDIKEFWIKYKFKEQELQYGAITKILPHGKSGFILADDGESLYFRTYEFKDDRNLLVEGQRVSFFTEKSFDRSKNRESINAVNININK